MEIKRISDLNLQDLRQLYLDVRQSTFNWLNTNDYTLANFDQHTEGELIYGAIENEKILGFISIWEPDNFIHNLFVALGSQRQGVGEKLLNFAKNLDQRPMKLKCLIKNTTAIKFYEKNHFVIESEEKDDLGDYYVMVSSNT